MGLASAEKMMQADPLNTECWANKRRMVSPISREFAFVYQFHEDVRVLYQLAYLGEESFRKHLENLKNNIAAYESVREGEK